MQDFALDPDDGTRNERNNDSSIYFLDPWGPGIIHLGYNQDPSTHSGPANV